MFTVKFVGGAKKSFPAEYLKIDKSGITIQELINLLPELKPKDAPELDTDNVLIAINGADSSAMDGKSTKIKDNDVISIIPIIHGGTLKKFTFEYSKKQIQIIEIKGQKSIDVKFIDHLREKYPKLLLQAVSCDFILDSYHLKKIISLSIESKKNNVLLSNKIETDILMRFALTTQISDAIKNVGIRPKSNFILISIGNKKTLNYLYRELTPISVNLFSKNNEGHLKKHFKITKKHIDSIYSKNPLADILVEKAAVLF
ncbi:KEOPS complex subunit Cgi121 [Candidatus Nitrosopumilus sediminis]|uniref:Sulfur carrier protein ThiS n=1 Tax=Candidatus Nitrosopumilus sediminis TaxID=1229909 RepID=K0BD39_9ARCH|nr:KEOPS complex subunit Cgi121 [Candidatus Nitrosopumilus sediminis]AFS83359.1 sulfur carrier protein ThiS [Candidatus Nitrosopumilus sediminis]